MEKEPAPISSIKPLTPPGLDHAIRRCLAKDPDERWQAGRDLALELKWISETGPQAGVPALVSSRKNRGRLAWSITTVVASLALVGFFSYQQLASPSAVVLVSDLAAPKGKKYNSLVNGRAEISPDGHAVFFSARDASSGDSSLWVRAIGGSPAQRIPGTETAGVGFWSPDSLFRLTQPDS